MLDQTAFNQILLEAVRLFSSLPNRSTLKKLSLRDSITYAYKDDRLRKLMNLLSTSPGPTSLEILTQKLKELIPRQMFKVPIQVIFTFNLL